MADNIIEVPLLNPLKFVRLGYENPAPYNTKYFEDWVFSDTIRDFEQQTGHLQPFQNNDIIEICILSNYQPFNAKLLDCAGNIVDSFLIEREAASTDVTGLFAYRASIALDEYDEGVYRLKILCGEPEAIDTLISEWFYIKETHENTFLLEYTHDENDFDIPFELDINFRKRCRGGFAQYAPKVDRVVFVDQPRNAVQLNAKPYSLWKLFFGDGEGIPDWDVERNNMIFCCSSVEIDGKAFTANENAQLEPNREADYPKAGWSLEVRPAARQSKRFVATGESEEGPTTTLVYNIETRGFGAIDSGGASDNTVQVTATNAE